MSNQRTTHSNESDRMKWYHGIIVIHESLATDDHRPVCKHFGCGKPVNEMYNPCCVDHQQRPKIDVTKFIKL